MFHRQRCVPPARVRLGCDNGCRGFTAHPYLSCHSPCPQWAAYPQLRSRRSCLDESTELYVTWYFIGQGYSSLLPGLGALGQGVSKDGVVSNYTYINGTSGKTCNVWKSQTLPANFPPDNFFCFLFAVMLLSLISFFFLNTLSLAKREYAEEKLAPTSFKPSNTTFSGESHRISTGKRYRTE